MKRPALSDRRGGVLLPLYSLPGSGPVGDLGPAAYQFVDFLKASGQHWWQMLPFQPAGEANSPYRSPSAFAGSLIYVSSEGLADEGWLTAPEARLRGSSSSRADYHAARQIKEAYLRRAFRRFRENATARQRAAYVDFVRREKFWLSDYTLFTVLHLHLRRKSWTRWPAPLRERHPPALERARKIHAGEIAFREFVQWQFEIQWKKLKRYAAERGIGLIGDVPIFVSPDSADVWSHRDIFRLNADGTPSVVAGVPPDYFSKTGQLWGNPTYRWDVLAAQDYRWWLERLRRAFDCFDAVRLDHFIGFVRAYEVPARAKTALRGKYRSGPGNHFFSAVYRNFPNIKFIAENLGAVTPTVEVLRERWRMPGMHVMQFEWENSPIEKNSVVYTGTHDNDTTRGWHRRLPRVLRDRVTEKFRATPNEPVSWKLLESAYHSRAGTAIVPVQDLLDLDSSARTNLPGTVRGNWRWRLLPNQLTSLHARRLRALTEESRRI